MWTGFGVRTLADDMGAHNPVSYHNGSVRPHDSAIAAAGLARYGYRVEAQWIDVGLLDAAHNTGQRLPELFCGSTARSSTRRFPARRRALRRPGPLRRHCCWSEACSG